jgi:serine/threonine-protein kinase
MYEDDTKDVKQTRIQRASTRARTTGRRTTGIPANMLERMPSRLAGASLTYATGFFFATLSGTLVSMFVQGQAFEWQPAHTVGAVFIPFALFVALLARRASLAPETLHVLGLVFGVVASFGIGLAVFSMPWDPQNVAAWGISWVCVWIVVFPLIVPTTPRRAALAATASAIAGAVAMLFWTRLPDHPMPNAAVVTMMTIPNFICAILATLEAYIIYGMGKEVERAREMGSYRLIELLGRGGMGEVWSARHRMLARPAAIKLVRPEFLGNAGEAVQAVRRFEREAQATAALTSPHSIGLYDFGMTDDGSFYYVMELLDGLDLETLVQRFGPLPAERAVSLLSQAARALADAHHHGLIHRDIKPANIYTCRMGLEYDFVKVLDYGLVKPSRQALAEDAARLTAEATITGTPAYVSPEAALGQRIDARADLYSLGCVGYWLLTGRLVFEGTSPMQIILQHAKDQPRPPSKRSELEVPEELDSIILWCLEKNPDKRPENAPALCERLDAVVTGNLWTEERARSWWLKHVPMRDDASVEAEAAPATKSLEATR